VPAISTAAQIFTLEIHMAGLSESYGADPNKFSPVGRRPPRREGRMKSTKRWPHNREMRFERFRWVALLLALAAPVLAQSGAPATKSPPILPFIEDDYARALAQAHARKLPIFVEAWAPW
jgi:hypothetical protein